MSKLYVTPDQLREDSWRLGAKILKDFQPDMMVALWRGGAPIGCYVHELLKYANIKTDHIAIRTSKYISPNTPNDQVQVHNIKYLKDTLTPNSKLLIIDDIHDTGHSIQAVLQTITTQLGPRSPHPDNIRVATIYYKPTKNQTNFKPHYYIHETDAWVVFPHELESMTQNEISTHYGPRISDIIFPLNKSY